MARIPLTSGFQILPEGEYVFRIYDVTYDENFGKAVVKMVTAKGQLYSERFTLKDKNDQWNDNALGAFSYFAKTALNDFDREDIDPNELIGHYIRASIEHTEVQSNRDPNKTVTFANLGRDKEPADGFDEAPSARVVKMFEKIDGTVTPAPAPTQEEKKSSGFDLDALLNS